MGHYRKKVGPAGKKMLISRNFAAFTEVAQQYSISFHALLPPRCSFFITAHVFMPERGCGRLFARTGAGR